MPGDHGGSRATGTMSAHRGSGWLRGASGACIPLVDRADHDDIVATARAQIDEASFEAAWAAGRAMPLEQAIAYALEDAPSGYGRETPHG